MEMKMTYDLAIATDLNTYAVRDKLKAIGCRWNKDQCAWMAKNEAMWREGMAIAEAAGPAPMPTKNAPPRSVIQSRRDNAQARANGDHFQSGDYDNSVL
jgi:hypothetical protein